MEVFLGGNTVLPCAAEGNPGVNFQWLFPNGKPIRNTKKFIVSTNGSLVVTNVGLTDARNYTCAPYSDLGNGEQRHTELVVLCKANIFYFYFLSFGYKKKVIGNLLCLCRREPKYSLLHFQLLQNS